MNLENVHDVAALLPAEAAGKMHILRRLRDDAGSIQRGLVETGMAARQARTAAIERLRYVKRPPAGGKAAGDDHPAVITAQRSLDGANAELERVAQHEQVISATFATRDRLVIKIERALREAASTGKAFAPAAAVEPRLQKGEGILDAVERVRRQGRTIAADLHTVASAPVPSADAKRRMRAQIEAMAEMGRPNVSPLVEDVAGKVEFAQLHPLARPVKIVGQTEPDVLAFQVWLALSLNREGTLAAFDALVADEADDEAALSGPDRARKRKELEGDAAMVARQLTTLIWKARAEGLTVEHDEDADPLTVLGIDLIEAPAQPAASYDHLDVAGNARRARDAAEGMARDALKQMGSSD